jgi:hypothetical protein
MNGSKGIGNGKMKKGRRYIEPMTGRGDKDVKKRDIKKIKKEAATTWDGVSRPSNDLYRESFNRIFGKEKNEK